MHRIFVQSSKEYIEQSMQRNVLSGKALLDRFVVFDEEIRKSPAYNDSRYAGFYYYLAKCVRPKNIVEMGFGSSLLTGTFLLGCTTVKKYLGFKEQSEEHFSSRLAKKNIRKVFKGLKNFYVGNLHDDDFVKLLQPEPWDMIFIAEECSYDKYMQYLDVCWESLSENGIIVCEYLNKNKSMKDAFEAFFKDKEADFCIVKTRYGTGVAQKIN